jgi:hypothetical protein
MDAPRWAPQSGGQWACVKWGNKEPFFRGRGRWRLVEATPYRPKPHAPALPSLRPGKLLVELREHPKAEGPRYAAADDQGRLYWFDEPPRVRLA